MYILSLLVLFINCCYAEKRLQFLFYGVYASAVYDPTSFFKVFTLALKHRGTT
jgi:hypothetical protein